jgi:hypothetical protein
LNRQISCKWHIVLFYHITLIQRANLGTLRHFIAR